MDETAANIEESQENEDDDVEKSTKKVKVDFAELPDLFKETMKEKVADHVDQNYMSIYTDTKVEKFFKKWCPCIRTKIAKWKNNRIKR